MTEPEPHSSMDALLSLLLLAGEELVASQCPNAAFPVRPVHATPISSNPAIANEDLDVLVSLVEQVQALAAGNKALERCLSQLPAAFGNGETLRLLFLNLFGPQQFLPDFRPAGEQEAPSERELEVLYLVAANNHSREEIADKLSISRRTVDKHLQNVYRKLGANRPQIALAEAVARGHMEINTIGHMLYRIRRRTTERAGFQTFCSTVGAVTPPFTPEEVNPLAAFGLLLLAVSGAAARQRHGDVRVLPAPRGALCELNKAGSVLRTFGAEVMNISRGIAIAPEQARERGFTPGHLFVIHDLIPQHDLNRAAISEFTPEGEFIRSFCGGREVSTRLIGPVSIAFAADGRLLATSGWLTDAILAFDRGGQSVQRLIEGLYCCVCVGSSGRVYAAQTIDAFGHIDRWEPYGQIERLPAAELPERWYYSLAVNSAEHLFAISSNNQSRLLRELDSEGNLVDELPIAADDVHSLTFDGSGNLYLFQTHDVRIFSPAGKLLQRIDLEGKLVPTCAAISRQGRLWVGGKQSAE